MFYKFNKDTLDFERVNVTKKSLFGFGFAVGLLFVFGFTSNPANKVQNLSKEEKLIVIREYNEFSEARLRIFSSELNGFSLRQSARSGWGGRGWGESEHGATPALTDSRP